MEMSGRSHWFKFAVAVALSFSAIEPIHAASLSVTAVLSNSEPAVGEAVQLQIKVSVAQSANVPQEISIDGLQIHQTGKSRQFEMRTLYVSSSVTYNYTSLPMRTGKFKIPPQT